VYERLADIYIQRRIHMGEAGNRKLTCWCFLPPLAISRGWH